MAKDDMSSRKLRCSFCGKSQDQVRRIIAGPGAYICNDMECFEKAVKKRSLERALKCAIPAEVYEKLREQIQNG